MISQNNQITPQASSSLFDFTRASCHPRFQAKAQRKPAKLRPCVLETRKRKERGRNLIPSTSTKCWNKFTPTLEFLQKLCPSWTLSWTIFLKEFPPKLAVWLTTIKEAPSHPERFRLLLDCFYPVNLPSTPSVKVPRLSPNTLPPSRFEKKIKSQNRQIKRPFSGPIIYTRNKHYVTGILKAISLIILFK